MHSGRPAKSESLTRLQQSPSLTMICLELRLVIFETPFLNFTLLCLRPLAQYRRPILSKNIYLVLLSLNPNYLLHLIQLQRGVVSAASVRPGRYFNRLLQPQARCQFLLLMTMKKFEVMILMNPYHQPSDRLSGRQSGPSVIRLDSFANILAFPVIIRTTSSVPKTLPMRPFHPPMTQAHRMLLFEMDHPWQRIQRLAKKLPRTFLSRTPPHTV